MKQPTSTASELSFKTKKRCNANNNSNSTLSYRYLFSEFVSVLISHGKGWWFEFGTPFTQLQKLAPDTFCYWESNIVHVMCCLNVYKSDKKKKKLPLLIVVTAFFFKHCFLSFLGSWFFNSPITKPISVCFVTLWFLLFFFLFFITYILKI